MNHAPDCAARLLAAARALFARRGYDGTSVRAITAKAKANLGAITYHFGSKEALYHKVIESITEPFVDRVAAAAAGPGAPLNRIEAIVRTFFKQMERHPEMPALIIRVLASERRMPPPAARTMQRNIRALSETIRAGQRDGSIRAGDPILLSMSVVAQPLHLALTGRLLEQALGLDRHDPATRARLVRHVVETVRAALARHPKASP